MGGLCIDRHIHVYTYIHIKMESQIIPSNLFFKLRVPMKSKNSSAHTCKFTQKLRQNVHISAYTIHGPVNAIVTDRTLSVNCYVRITEFTLCASVFAALCKRACSLVRTHLLPHANAFAASCDRIFCLVQSLL